MRANTAWENGKWLKTDNNKVSKVQNLKYETHSESDHNLVYFLTQRLICRQILMERRQYLPTQSASDHRGVKTNGFPRGVGEKTKKNTNGWLSCFVGLSIRTNCMPADNGLSVYRYDIHQVKTSACQ